jgi:tellurite resistance protein
MQRPIDEHTALIFTMVFVSDADDMMDDRELETMTRQVSYWPIFRGFDSSRLAAVGRQCAELLEREDGVDLACEVIAEALPPRLCETAYALACEVAVADGELTQEELRLLELLRDRLKVDPLVAHAIERATRARSAVL